MVRGPCACAAFVEPWPVAFPVALLAFPVPVATVLLLGVKTEFEFVPAPEVWFGTPQPVTVRPVKIAAATKIRLYFEVKRTMFLYHLFVLYLLNRSR